MEAFVYENRQTIGPYMDVYVVVISPDTCVGTFFLAFFKKKEKKILDLPMLRLHCVQTCLLHRNGFYIRVHVGFAIKQSPLHHISAYQTHKHTHTYQTTSASREYFSTFWKKLTWITRSIHPFIGEYVRHAFFIWHHCFRKIHNAMWRCQRIF